MIPPTIDVAGAGRRTWDVVVVGAGPAGALAARETARRGLKVLLIDRATFPRGKVCGCCLGGRALATLDAVGLGDLPRRQGAVPLREIVLAARGCRARLELPSSVALSREAFDAALVVAAVESGADFLPGTAARLGPVDAEARHVVLGTTDSVLTRLVLAADGLGGRFLAEGAGEIAEGSRIGAGVVVPSAPHAYTPGSVFMACSAPGYVGLVRLEDGRLDVAAALDRAAVRRAGGPGALAEAILDEAGLPPLAGLASLPWRGTPALTRHPKRRAAERVLALGDAAGYVEPFTGEGMTWALAAAVAAAPLAGRAARRWEPSLARAWEAAYRRTVTERQHVCRAAARLLRHPRLVRATIYILGRMPGLAAPVLHALNETTSPLPTGKRREIRGLS